MNSLLCPYCDNVFSVYPRAVYPGETEEVQCPHCQRVFRVRYIVEVEYAENYAAPGNAQADAGKADEPMNPE